jgi:hypothetical protein
MLAFFISSACSKDRNEATKKITQSTGIWWIVPARITRVSQADGGYDKPHPSPFVSIGHNPARARLVEHIFAEMRNRRFLKFCPAEKRIFSFSVRGFRVPQSKLATGSKLPI